MANTYKIDEYTNRWGRLQKGTTWALPDGLRILSRLSCNEAHSYPVGASLNWGLLSAGGNVSHSDATDASRQMVDSFIKGSFDCEA